MGAVRQYLQAQIRQDELVEWCVSLCGRGHEELLGTEPALSVAGVPVNRISRTRLRSPPYSIGSLVNPATRGGEPGTGDEEVGLTPEQLAAARAEARETGDFPRALRRQRDRREGLLLLYPISPYSRPRSNEGTRLPLFDNPERDGVTVLGVAIVFPVSDSAATVEYVLGSVGGLTGGEA